MPEQLLSIEQNNPEGDWRDAKVEFRKGTICYGGAPKHVAYLGLPNPREWQPFDADWKLPPNWKKSFLKE